MKNQVKKFGQFLRESDGYEYRYKGGLGGDVGRKHRGIAVWDSGPGYGGEWSMVSYGGDSIDIEIEPNDVDEESGEYVAWEKLFRAAAKLGADPNMLYSLEDDRVIHRGEY